MKLRNLARNSQKIPQLRTKRDFFKNSFFSVDYKRLGKSGPAYQKIQKRLYFQKQYFKIHTALTK